MSDRRPLTDFQIASLSPISGVASSTLKFHRADAVASGAVGALVGAAAVPVRDHLRHLRVVGG